MSLETIKIYNFELSTFGLFVFLGILFMLYVVWKEATKDGFDEERIFDLVILTTFFSLLFSRIFFAIFGGFPLLEILKFAYEIWRPGNNIYGIFFGFLLAIYFFCKRWSFSLYRILDIFSLGITFGFSIVVLAFVGLQQRFEFLIGFALWMFLYVFLSKYRNNKVKSGHTFSIFLSMNSLLGLFFFNERFYLPLYLIFITLSIAILVLRERKETKMQVFSAEFLKQIKSKLLEKNIRLKRQEQELKNEDPYLQQGRVDDNASFVDDAYEYIAKENQEATLGFVTSTRIQIKRALAKMKIGKYGICEVCNRSIDKARLEIYPEATTCVEHAKE